MIFGGVFLTKECFEERYAASPPTVELHSSGAMVEI